jgi:hypothetical protein
MSYGTASPMIPMIGGQTFLNLISSFLQAFQSQGENINPMPQTNFDKLKKIKFNEIKEQLIELTSASADGASQIELETSCAICTEEFEQTSECVVLPCKHYFHVECIKKWLTEYHAKCPLCRADV